MHSHLTRRDILAGMAGTSIAVSTAAAQAPAAPARPRDPFTYCLNTSTIRGQNLPITDEIDIVARAGYQAIEPWINELERYVQGGGNLRDLNRRIRDAGLVVPSAIGFMDWVVDDETAPSQRPRNGSPGHGHGPADRRPAVGRSSRRGHRSDRSQPDASGRTVSGPARSRGEDRRRAAVRGVGLLQVAEPARRMRDDRGRDAAIRKRASSPTSIICTKGARVSPACICSAAIRCSIFT